MSAGGPLIIGLATVMHGGSGKDRDYAEGDEDRADSAARIAGGFKFAADFRVAVFGGKEFLRVGFIDIAVIVSHGMEGRLGRRVLGRLFI